MAGLARLPGGRPASRERSTTTLDPVDPPGHGLARDDLAWRRPIRDDHASGATAAPVAADSYSAAIVRAWPRASSRPRSGAVSPRIAALMFSCLLYTSPSPRD